MSSLVEKIRDDIVRAIKQDELVLPTLPEVALRVREVAEDPDASIKDLNSVIGNDAALTARIIKVSNSPLMRGSSEIEDLKMALMRLGMEYTSNIATGLAMEQMFQATTAIVDKRMREVWQKSSEIAGICYVLCMHSSTLRPDQATLAGLVHNIGVLPILTYAEENTEILKDSITLEKVIHVLHRAIGNKILEKWDFPEELRKIPSQHLDFKREAPAADYADLVTVAMLQSYMGTNHPYSKVDYHEVTAFQRLGLDPDMQDTEAEDLSEDMQAAIAMLG